MVVVVVVAEVPVVASEDPEEELPVPGEAVPVTLEPVVEVVESTLALVAEAPGRSCATRMPMAAVAPVAVMMAPRVRSRNRPFALSLSVPVLGRSGADMRKFLGRR